MPPHDFVHNPIDTLADALTVGSVAHIARQAPPPGSSATRKGTARRFLYRLALACVALSLPVLVVACGDDDASEDVPTVTATESPAFPVTVEHKFGSTTIEAQPERVVSVGFQEQDTILALGVKPIAVREWWNEQPFATWIWARDELGDAEPVVFGAGELDIEAVISLDPDLIIAPYGGLTEEEYDLLSRAAPTIPQPGKYEDYTMPWREQTLLIGRVLGKEAEAQELIDGVDEAFAAARDEHPEFERATFVIAGASGDGSYWLYGQNDPRSRLVADLGFVMPDELVEEVGDVFYATLSGERASLLDTDVVLWLYSGEEELAALESDQLFQHLSAVQEGRMIFFDWSSDIAGAFSFSSVLSLPFLLDELVPRLEAAIDGDPTTTID